jgi:hypothetical protein
MADVVARRARLHWPQALIGALLLAACASAGQVASPPILTTAPVAGSSGAAEATVLGASSVVPSAATVSSAAPASTAEVTSHTPDATDPSPNPGDPSTWTRQAPPAGVDEYLNMGNFIPNILDQPLSLERPDGLGSSTTAVSSLLTRPVLSIADVTKKKPPAVSIPSGVATAPVTVTVSVTVTASKTTTNTVSSKPVEVKLPDAVFEVGRLSVVVSPGARVKLITPANKVVAPVITDLRSLIELDRVGAYRIEADYGDVVVRANMRVEVTLASVIKLVDDQNNSRFLLSSPTDLAIPIHLYTREPSSVEHPCESTQVCFRFLSNLPTVQLKASDPIHFDVVRDKACVVFVGLDDAPKCPSAR